MLRITLVLLAASALACAQSSDPARAAKASQGSVVIDAHASASASPGTGGAALDVCGTFTLQPYSLDASGEQTLAGEPFVVASTAGASVDVVEGCIDGSLDGTLNGSANNWGYLVTATGFNNCADGGTIAGLSPETFTANYPIDCEAGVDVSLDIDVDLAIPEANDAG